MKNVGKEYYRYGTGTYSQLPRYILVNWQVPYKVYGTEPNAEPRIQVAKIKDNKIR